MSLLHCPVTTGAIEASLTSDNEIMCAMDYGVCFFISIGTPVFFFRSSSRSRLPLGAALGSATTFGFSTGFIGAECFVVAFMAYDVGCTTRLKNGAVTSLSRASFRTLICAGIIFCFISHITSLSTKLNTTRYEKEHVSGCYVSVCYLAD